MKTVWRLQLAGAPCLWQDGPESNGPPQDEPRCQPRFEPLGRKDAAWLACVALQGQSASRLVAAMVWPAASERGALNSLRQRVHRLRKATGARLVEMAEAVVLAGDLQLDDPAALLARLENDPAAADAELLAGISFDAEPDFAAWLAGARASHAARRREALARIASEAQNAGELARALRYAQRLLADDPLSEHSYRRLMRLHYLRGDRAAAVAAFEHCERVLKDELGVKPGAETLALLDTIERAVAPLVELASPRQPLPAGLLRPPRTVGREIQARQLAQAFADAAVPVLVGEAGLGKTRLLQDFVAARPQAVYVQARPSDAAVPYGALARLLRAVIAATAAEPDAPSAPAESATERALACLLPELPAAAGATSATELQAAVNTLLQRAAAAGRTPLVVDDLHFADRASIEMLRGLIDAPAASAVQWVLAQRPAAAGDEHAALLRTLVDAPQVRWIELAPLAEPALAELVASLGLGAAAAGTALIPALARHAGGNPLYVIETLRALAAGLRHGVAAASGEGAALPRPPAIEHLLDRRLERLSKPALALARVAAIAAPDFSIELAEQALATPALVLADAWRELESADVLAGETFAHDLIHDAVLRATPTAIARHAHKQVAAFLAQRHAEPARVAGHWRAAGQCAEAALAFEAAAARAGASGRSREQAELLEQAALAHEQGGAVDAAAALRIDSVSSMLRSLGVESALAQARRVLAGKLGTAQRARAHCAHAMALLWARRPAEAESAALQAIELCAPADIAVALPAARFLAQARAHQGDTAGAVAAVQAWQTRADTDADLAARVHFYGDYTSLLMRADRPLEALPVAERHLALAEQAGDLGERAGGLLNVFALRLRRGEVQAALQVAQTADALLDTPSQTRLTWAWNRTHLGIALCGVARFTDGLAALHEAHAALLESGSTPLLALNQNRQAEVLLLLGQTARAQALLGGSGLVLDGNLQAARLVVQAQLAHDLGADSESLWRQAGALAQRDSSQYDRLRVEIELLRFDSDYMRAGAAALRLAQQAGELGYLALALTASAQRLALLLAAKPPEARPGPARSSRGFGQVGEARFAGEPSAAGRSEIARLAPWVESQTRALAGPGVYLPQRLIGCALAYGSLGRGADSDRCLRDAWRWITEQALPGMPVEYRDGFLERNEWNRAVRSALTRRGQVIDPQGTGTAAILALPDQTLRPVACSAQAHDDFKRLDLP